MYNFHLFVTCRSSGIGWTHRLGLHQSTPVDGSLIPSASDLTLCSPNCRPSPLCRNKHLCPFFPTDERHVSERIPQHITSQKGWRKYREEYITRVPSLLRSERVLFVMSGYRAQSDTRFFTPRLSLLIRSSAVTT